MKKIIKTIILLPLWPLIWLTGMKSSDSLYDKGGCERRAIHMLRWRDR